MLDSRVRPGHAKHHGLVLPKDDPFWDTHYPPNAWNCRCKVNAYTKSQLEKRGYEVSKVAPESFAHKDWAYHVGKTDNISKIYDNKIAKISDSGLKKAALKEKQTLVKKAFKSVAKKQLNEMIDEVIVKGNVKTPINIIQVGHITQTLASMAKKLLKEDVKSGGIILTKKELTHASPKRKEAYNHSFRVDEMRQIIDVLEDDDNAYIDLRDKHKNIVYIFEDEKDNTKLNLIPIEISKMHKKFKINNYVITLDKVDKISIKRLIEKKYIRKISE